MTSDTLLYPTPRAKQVHCCTCTSTVTHATATAGSLRGLRSVPARAAAGAALGAGATTPAFPRGTTAAILATVSDQGVRTGVAVEGVMVAGGTTAMVGAGALGVALGVGATLRASSSL